MWITRVLQNSYSTVAELLKIKNGINLQYRQTEFCQNILKDW